MTRGIRLQWSRCENANTNRGNKNGSGRDRKILSSRMEREYFKVAMGQSSLCLTAIRDKIASARNWRGRGSFFSSLKIF